MVCPSLPVFASPQRFTLAPVLTTVLICLTSISSRARLASHQTCHIRLGAIMVQIYKPVCAYPNCSAAVADASLKESNPSCDKHTKKLTCWALTLPALKLLMERYASAIEGYNKRNKQTDEVKELKADASFLKQQVQIVLDKEAEQKEKEKAALAQQVKQQLQEGGLPPPPLRPASASRRPRYAALRRPPA